MQYGFVGDGFVGDQYQIFESWCVWQFGDDFGDGWFVEIDDLVCLEVLFFWFMFEVGSFFFDDDFEGVFVWFDVDVGQVLQGFFLCVFFVGDVDVQFYWLL